MLTSRREAVLRCLEAALPQALRAAGEAGADAAAERMRRGYASPVIASGALLRDLQVRPEGARCEIGNTLPYAAYVHNGTSRVPARPYLRDGMREGAERIARALRETLRARMT